MNVFQSESSGPSVGDGGHGRRFLYTGAWKFVRILIFLPQVFTDAWKDAQRRSMSWLTAMSVGQDEQKLSQILIDLDTETAEGTHITVFGSGPFQAYRLQQPRPENSLNGSDIELTVQRDSTISDEVAGIAQQDTWSEDTGLGLESWEFTIIDHDQLPTTRAAQNQFSSLVMALSIGEIGSLLI